MITIVLTVAVIFLPVSWNIVYAFHYFKYGSCEYFHSILLFNVFKKKIYFCITDF